ncbi:prepilin-type N-terminal cleavage/methylation domain-containing protein [Emcibacter nanhaiensis]|uniref:Prepilin-type N-terminal cleavage/methylation domain-containing protein n=1 Tax=Emcibacter nanhaiensis TaxID=1505037 RepID=A0A501PGH6_9PROT|nr:prepilin-type N-terminal cleavage/methylation domain-containing protein [Emcibacter nanhaiensis]TPD58976.1 hypothetical protein FIV46_12125 [Emcibacter nanhaiensis]
MSRCLQIIRRFNRGSVAEQDHQGGEDGFTLVEVLVSFVLLGFVLALLYVGFSYANRVFARTTDLSSWTDDVVQVQDLLRGLISQAYPDPTMFQGGLDRVDFLAPVTRQGRENGLHKVVLQRASGDGSDKLTLTLSSVGKAEPKDEEKFVLMENIEAMEFSYFSIGLHGQTGTWVSHWEKGRELPQAFRLSLKLKRALKTNETQKTQQHGQIDWPTLIVPLQVTQNVDCRFDPVSRKCI